MKRICLIVIVVLLAGGAARADGAEPVIRISSAPDPNEHGWLARGGWTDLWIQGLPASETLGSCWVTSRVDTPDYTVSGLWPILDPTAGTCEASTSHVDSGLHTLTLGFEHDGIEYVGSHVVKVDLDPPSVTVDQPDPAVAVGTIRLQGVAVDDMSAPLDVRVRFRDTLGLHEPRVVDAICSECGVADGCDHRKGLKQCRTSRAWSLTAALPPSQWIATPVVRDLALNEAVGEWVQIIVV